MLNPLVVIVAALADSVNPCAISVLLITIGFLVSLKKSRGEILKIGSTYILAIFVTYVLIGIGLSYLFTVMAEFLAISHGSITKSLAVVMLVLAVISILEMYIPNFPIKLQIPSFAKGAIAKYIQQSTIPAAVILGILVALTEFPCTGGPYTFIIGYLRERGTLLVGFGYLLLYNLIFVLPLIIILWFGSQSKVLEKIEDLRKTKAKMVNLISSGVLILLSLVIIFQEYVNNIINQYL
jgi:cytochrome c biogenesis protein CcdA